MLDTVKLNKEKVSNYILETEINDLDIIQFLKLNIDNDLILHNIDKYNFTYTVKETEKSKCYVFPAILFTEELPSETETYITSNENKQNPIRSVFNYIHNDENKIVKYGLICLTIGIIVKGFLPSNANMLTTGKFIGNQEIKQEIQVKTDFELLTQKANKNREVIAKQLQEQKRLRDLLSESINEVKELENKNDTIRNNLIQLSQ